MRDSRFLIVGLILSTVACSSGAATTTPPTTLPTSTTSTTTTPSTTSTTTAPSSSNRLEKAIEGQFQVGDLKLWLSCGPGDLPVVVFVHGLGGHPRELSKYTARLDGQSYCIYDRVNGTMSSRVEGVRPGTAAVSDLTGLLDAAEIPGPYLLYGASLGGWIAMVFAATHPDRVIGLILEDGGEVGDTSDETMALFRDDIADWLRTWNAGDNKERIDMAELDRKASELIGSMPDIPMVYLAAPFRIDIDDISEAEADAIDAHWVSLRLNTVAAFPRGRYRLFPDAEHYNFPHTDVIAEIEAVLSAAGY